MSKSSQIDNKETMSAKQNALKITAVTSKAQHTLKKPSFTFLNNQDTAKTNSSLIEKENYTWRKSVAQNLQNQSRR